MKFGILLFLLSSSLMAKPSLTEVMEKTRCLPLRSALTGEIEGESCFNPKDIRGQKNTEKGAEAPLKKVDSKKINDEEVEKLMKDIQ